VWRRRLVADQAREKVGSIIRVRQYELASLIEDARAVRIGDIEPREMDARLERAGTLVGTTVPDDRAAANELLDKLEGVLPLIADYERLRLMLEAELDRDDKVLGEAARKRARELLESAGAAEGSAFNRRQGVSIEPATTCFFDGAGGTALGLVAGRHPLCGSRSLSRRQSKEGQPRSEDDVLFTHRLRLPDYAARTSVSEACRAFGAHHSDLLRLETASGGTRLRSCARGSGDSNADRLPFPAGSRCPVREIPLVLLLRRRREVGPDVTSVAPGDHVVMRFSPQCRECVRCETAIIVTSRARSNADVRVGTVGPERANPETLRPFRIDLGS
jgi:hypothetical protein